MKGTTLYIVIGVAVLIAGAAGYFFFIKDKKEESQTAGVIETKDQKIRRIIDTKILKDSVWKANTQTRADESGRTFEEQLIEEAKSFIWSEEKAGKTV